MARPLTIAACAVLLAAAFGSDVAVASTETEVDTVSGDTAKAGEPETLTVKSTSKKSPLICKWDTPVGTRVAKRMCHRSSDVENAQQSTRTARAVADDANIPDSMYNTARQ